MEYTPLPHRIVIGTVLLSASSRCVDVSEIGLNGSFYQ